MTNRAAWGFAAALAVVVLGGIGLLGVRLRPYWVAKHRGVSACLGDASLAGAPLRQAILDAADLRGADLRCADLEGASLCVANLAGADLRGTDLEGTRLGGANLAGADLRGAGVRFASDWVFSSDLIGGMYATFAGAAYDSRTRWPKGFDPKRHGAVRVK